MSHMTKSGMHDPDADLHIDGARRAMWDEHRRNFDYFTEHSAALFAEHPDGWLLIHSGGEVVASKDLFELFDLRNTFDDVTWGAAMIEVARSRPMIPTPFFIR